jgi:hypothetical protein
MLDRQNPKPTTYTSIIVSSIIYNNISGDCFSLVNNSSKQYISFPQLYVTNSSIHLHCIYNKLKGIHHLINELIFGFKCSFSSFMLTMQLIIVTISTLVKTSTQTITRSHFLY